MKHRAVSRAVRSGAHSNSSPGGGSPEDLSPSSEAERCLERVSGQGPGPEAEPGTDWKTPHPAPLSSPQHGEENGLSVSGLKTGIKSKLLKPLSLSLPVCKMVAMTGPASQAP